MIEDKDSPLCLAPWVHSFVNTRGKRNLCCFRDFETQEVSTSDQVGFENYWNSDQMKNTRLMMLAGQLPEQCFPCAEHIFYNQRPRNFFFDKYTHLKEHVREHTKADGHTDLLPRFYDYRFSNLCQLACRMCDERSSSRIEQIYQQSDSYESVDQRVRPFIDSHLFPELLSAVEEGRVDQLYWAGGEPLLSPEHWKIMKAAITSGHAGKIEVIYNTNLGLLKTTDGDLESLLPSFKKTTVLASLDGVGELGEFIRSGLRWSQFQANLKVLRQMPNVSVMLTITLTLPGLLEIEKLARYICEEQLDYDVHFASANGVHELFTPLILPKKLCEKIVKGAISRCEELKQPRLKGLIDNLKLILSHPTLEQRFSENFEEQFFLHRERYLKREEKEASITLAQFYQKHDQELYLWWTRKPARKKARPEDRERELYQDWIKVQESMMNSGRVAILYRQENAMTDHFRTLSQPGLDCISFDRCHQIPKGVFEVMIMNNEWPSMAEMEYLRERLPINGKLSVIAPVNSFLNRWIHRHDFEAYQKKCAFETQYSAFLVKRFSSLSYMGKQRNYPKLMISLLRFAEFFIPTRLIALHGHFILPQSKA